MVINSHLDHEHVFDLDLSCIIDDILGVRKANVRIYPIFVTVKRTSLY